MRGDTQNGWPEAIGQIIQWVCVAIIVVVVIVGALALMPGCTKPITIEHVIKIEMPDEVRALLELIGDPNRAPSPDEQTEYLDRLVEEIR